MAYGRVFLISFLFILGCNDARDGRSLTFGVEEFPKELDPVESSGIYEVQIYSQLYETLINLDSDYNTLVPNLAESWSVSADHCNFTFRLRDGVYFHDGSDLQANDVEYSILRRINENKSSILAKAVNSVTTIDSLTINIELKYSYYQFLYALTSPFNLVISSRRGNPPAEDNLTVTANGTGPFQLVNWMDGEEIVLSSFSDYWQDTNQLDYLIFRSYKDDFLREQLLENEEVDIIYLVTGSMIDRLKWKGVIEYYVTEPTNIIFIGFNNINKPFNDIRARKAVLKAINLPKLVVYLSRGNAITAQGPLPPCLFKSETLRQDTYNIQEARMLLKEAGYGTGLKIKFYFPMVSFSRQTIIEMLRSELEKVGISLEVTLFNSWDEHDRWIKSDSSQMFIDSYGSDVLGDAHHYLYSLFDSKSATNSLHYARTQVDELLDAACREVDARVRQKLYANVVKHILQDVPAVFLFHVKPHFAYNRKIIKKMMADPYQIIQFHRIEFHD